jgi:hypothetical protein
MKHANREQRVEDGESSTERKTCRPPRRFIGSPPLTGPSGVAKIASIISIIVLAEPDVEWESHGFNRGGTTSITPALSINLRAGFLFVQQIEIGGKK